MNYLNLFDRIVGISGNDSQLMGHCPFHDDKIKSFSFNVDTGLWNCFAGCGSGNAYQFAKRLGIDPSPYKNGSFPQTFRAFPKNHGNGGTGEIKTTELGQEHKSRAMMYHKHLLDNFDELTKDLPWKKEAVKKTYTGYNPQTKCFTFVHTNDDGKALALKHHKPDPNWKGRQQVGNAKSRFYAKHILNDYVPNIPLIYCEGESDFISLLSQGLQPITGTCGVASYKNLDHTELPKFEEIFIVLDNDESGIIESKEVAGKIKTDLPNIKIHLHKWHEKPNKYDITDFFNHGGNAESFLELIKPVFRDFPVYQGAKIDWNRMTTTPSVYLDLVNDTTDAPDEFILLSLLGLWAGVVGNKIKLSDPEDLYPNLWLILFGKSSEIRKSTAIKVAGKPFTSIQAKFDKEFSEEMSGYEDELSQWNSLSKKEKSFSPKPKEPSLTRLILESDFSEAGFFKMLKNNPAAGTIVATEFSDFHRKLHREYTNMSDAFLSAYDNDRMTRNTIKHGTEIIEKPTFTILGATTIANFTKVFTATETENGFLQRIMPVFLAEPTKKRMGYLQRTKLDPDFINAFEKMAMNWFRHDEVIEVKLTEEIKDSFSKWEERFITESKANYGKEISPHLERMVPVCLKLAMLLESLNKETPPAELIISQKSCDCAQMIIEVMFLPSLVYLLENEIIFDRNLYDEKQIEKAIKEAGGIIDRTGLMRITRMSKNRMDEITETMIEKEKIELNEYYQDRKQGGGNTKKVYQWSDS